MATGGMAETAHNGPDAPTIATGFGLYVKDHTATIDRCTFSRNTTDGFNFDGTVAIVTNSFFTLNGRDGAQINTDTPGGRIQFCTSADNLHIGFDVGQAPATSTFDISNNLLAGNTSADLSCPSSNCVQTGSLLLGSNKSTAHFASSTDYHVMAGSVAIDAAIGGTLDHDFDGDPRPKGPARDVGADEAQ